MDDNIKYSKIDVTFIITYLIFLLLTQDNVTRVRIKDVLHTSSYVFF